MTTINTNIGAINAQANMTRVNDEMNTSMSRLSSGLRINAAKDDAAGMAIAEKMTSQIKGLNQAMRNATDGKNLVDTTEGAHVEISNMLQRLRELAVQSSNDTNTASNRNNIMSEANQLITEINAVSENTAFNGMKVLDGSFTGKQLQVGADAGQVLSLNIDSAAATDIGAHSFKSDVQITAAGSPSDSNIQATATLTVSGYAGSKTLTPAAGASAKDMASAINAVSASTGVEASAVTKAKLTLDAADTISFALGNSSSEQVSVGSVSVTDTSDLRAVRDAVNAVSGRTGITAAMGDTNAEVILTDANGDDIGLSAFTSGGTDKTLTVSALKTDGTADGTAAVDDTNTGAYVTGQIEMTSTKAFTVTSADTDATETFAETGANASKLNDVASVDLTTAQGASDAIKVLDVALQKISQSRSDLGAVSNRLDSTISNLTNITTNVEAARSGVMDADFAKESSAMARGKILSQAATAMLAQANASQQNVLSLLRG